MPTLREVEWCEIWRVEGQVFSPSIEIGTVMARDGRNK